jgi:putative aldouronate transport system substrate-binding protein
MNKKKMSRFLALAMVTMLSIGILSGCKKADPASAPKEGTKLSADQPGWKEDTTPITFDWYVNFSWFATKWGQDATSKYITKKTGVNVNYIVPAGNEAEKLNTMLASGKLPDFITLGWWEDAVKKMIEGQMVLP